MKKYCLKCGAQLPDGARFCEKCGAAVQMAVQMNPIPGRAAAEPVRTGPLPRAAAPVSPASGFGPSGRIKGTMAVLFGQIGKMIGGVFQIFTKLRALLFTAAISFLWIRLNHLRLLDGLDGAFAVLAKVTYSRGGTGGSVMEIIGGIIGKGVVGAALCLILYGGIGKMFRGIGKIFREPGFHVGAAILGFGFAGIAYTFTAGFAGSDGIPVGIAGAALSLIALSSGDGFLVNLAASFSAKKTGNEKRLLPGRYKGFLTGSAVGFLFWMLLTVTEKAKDLALDAWGWVFDTFSLDLPGGLEAYLLPAAVVLIGLILNAVGKGKGAQAA